MAFNYDDPRIDEMLDYLQSQFPKQNMRGCGEWNIEHLFALWIRKEINLNQEEVLNEKS